MLRTVSNGLILRKMPAPKKRKDGPKQAKKAAAAPKLSMLQVREKFLEEIPPLPYHQYPDERCFVERYKRPIQHLSDEEQEHRVTLQKDYTRYINQYWRQHTSSHQRQVELRTAALQHLQEVSTVLYTHAVNFDYSVFPRVETGLKESLPNPQHIAPLRSDSSYKVFLNEESIATNNREKEEKPRRQTKEKANKPPAVAVTI